MLKYGGEKVPITEPAEAGTIVAIEEDGFVVATSNETGVKITELQPYGKKRMSCSNFYVEQNLKLERS